MTAAHDNEILVRTMVDAFQRGDLATVGSVFAPDAVWDFPGHSVVNGTYKGPEEIVGFLARSFELSGGTLALDVVDVTASDAGACHAQWVSADHGGRSFRSVELIHHEIEHGAIVRTWHRSDDVAITGFFGEA
jgi:ketosteroid isomerase-like protein